MRYFPWNSRKDSGGATIEDTPVVVGCKKKIEIYVRASAEKNTISVQSVHNVNMKGKIV